MAKFTDVIAGLTETTDPQGDSDYIVGYDGTSVVKYLINNLPFATSGTYLTTDTALDALSAPSDNTNLDADTDTHGLLPKLSGDSDTYLNGVGGWAEPAGGSGTSYDYILIQDQKSAGTQGGTFTQDAWQTRTLNTEVVDNGNHASISSNQITLAAGSYFANIICPAQEVRHNQARLYNISDSSTVASGTASYLAPATTYASGYSFIKTFFTIAAQKILEVQHRCSVTVADNGFGTCSDLGETQIYTSVEMWKVA